MNQREFLAWLQPRLEQAGADPSRMVFRFDEGSAEADFEAARGLAEELKSLGFGFALSDYGATGNASRLMAQLPADYAELATALTEIVSADDEDPRLAGLVEAARERGVRLIAGHVRDANSMARLWQLGVHYIESRETLKWAFDSIAS